MKTETASTRTQGLLAMYDLQTPFLERAIEGISKEDFQNRLDTKANHMAWLTGALVQQRFSMTMETHPELKQTGHELFQDNKGIQDNVAYPSIEEYLKDWKMISPLGREVLVNITDEKLDSILDMGFMKMSYYDLITFSLYREASMIGQLALWRRLLGYPAMKYD